MSVVRLLILGAHPDDAEFHAGGLISQYVQRGHHVRIVSVTDGSAGHHTRSPQELIRVRREEADEVARRFGVEYDVWSFPDGELQPTLELRRRVIEEIRRFAPDLVLTHRTCDYHPDHRVVGQAVQDASYMVTVPHIVPQVPALRRDPIIAYLNDLFTRPAPLRPDIALDVTSDVATVVAMLAVHASQVFEWLPYNLGIDVPDDEPGRLEMLRSWYQQRATAVANQFRTALERDYGARGRSIEFAEAYEISEYAGKLTPETRARLFWWTTASGT